MPPITEIVLPTTYMSECRATSPPEDGFVVTGYLSWSLLRRHFAAHSAPRRAFKLCNHNEPFFTRGHNSVCRTLLPHMFNGRPCSLGVRLAIAIYNDQGTRSKRWLHTLRHQDRRQ